VTLPLEGTRAPEQAPTERILIDSSLWIEYYRPTGRMSVQKGIQDILRRDAVATMAMVVIEVLRGALTQEGYREIESDLTALHWLEVSVDVARRAARIGFDLERAGQRVPATDLLIAATAIEHAHTLWHDDRHFEVIARHSELAQQAFHG
jgi:hypothetical protein